MLDERSQVFFPEQYEVSQRDGEFAYWAPRQRVAVKVGPAGKSVLDACAQHDSVRAILDTAVKSLTLPEREGRATLFAFLKRMIDADFLSEQPIVQKAREAQPPSRFKPIVMYIHLTVHCNLSCSYCYNVEHREAAKDDKALTRFEFIDLIEEAADRDLKQIIFTGGEPLLSKDWDCLAERAKKLGINTGLVTNGAVINDRNAARIAELFSRTIVSLDSPIPEVHDAQRGRGSHARTMRGIQALRKVGYKGLALRPVITRLNLACLPSYPAFALEHCGTTQILLSPYAPNSPEEAAELQLLAATADLRAATAAFNRALNALGASALKPPEAEFQAMSRCGAGSGIVSVDFNGDVYPCQAIHDPLTKMGNVREQSAFEMGDSSAAVSFRSIDPNDLEICKSCSFNELCGGGCRATAFSAFRRITAHNRYACEGSKATAWDRIWAQLNASPDGAAIDPTASSCNSCASACG